MWIEALRHDVRYAARTLFKSPAFTITVIVTLALGVAASTTMFGQLNALFWKPLPVGRPADLRMLAWSSRRPTFVAMPNVAAGPHLPGGDTYGSFSYPAYVAMRDGARDAIDLACWADLGETRPVVMRDVGFGSIHFVSGNYFDVLAVEPVLGRLLTPADDVPGAAAVVISDAFWQRAFGGDARVLRRTIDLNGHAFSIVGVTRAGFFGVDPSTTPDVMVPVAAIQLAAATTNPLQNPIIWAVCRVIGRVAPHATDEQARRAAESSLHDAIRRTPPRDAYEPPRLWLVDASRGYSPARDAAFAPVVLLFASVVAIVAIACANIAGLLMVRSAARSREIATRLALGASRARIVRQLLTESAAVSVVGGAIGVGFAYALARMSPAFVSRLMPTLYGSDRHLGLTMAPDGRVLAFALAMTATTALVFGTIPAVRATRIDLIASIKEGTAGVRRSGWLSGDRAMVAVQAAISLVLLFAAGLLLQTLSNLRVAPLGFDPDRLLYASVEPRTGGVSSERRADYFSELVARVSAIPGVVAASATDDPPLSARSAIFLSGGAVRVCAGAFAGGPNDPTTGVAGVAPRYFETLRTRVVAGREFEARDQPRAALAAPPAIVNQAFARQFFAGQDALQRRFGLGPCSANNRAITVIGVVADVKDDPRAGVRPTVYFPVGLSGSPVTLVIRTAGDPQRLIRSIRRVAEGVNFAVPTFNELPAVDLREQRMREERLLTDLLTAFAAVALALSATGIYGMLAYMVVRRTRDIGIRMAIGATSSAIGRLVVTEAIAPVVAGLLAGAGISLAAGRIAASFLFGVSPYDARTLAIAALAFGAIAVAASAAPARRAAAIDPLTALRSE
jgi:predicted permease